MKIKFSESADFESLKNSINEFENDAEINSILVLITDSNNIDEDKFNALLTNLSKTTWGGIFPQLIFNGLNYENGFLTIGIVDEANVHLVKNISSGKVDFEEILEEQFGSNGNFNTMFVFVDGFAKRISAFVDALFNTFGLKKNILGGGAGSLSMKQTPCIISNQGLIKDAAVITFLNSSSGVGVSHGWKKIKGPFRVTESDKNEIISLDWEPAFDIYKKNVEAESGLKFTDSNFFDIAKAYPFGITKIDAEDIVRDPIAKTADNSLICIGEVPLNSYVNLLSGNPNSLIKAADTAYNKAVAAYTGANPQTVFVFDCISRVLYLNDEIKDELANAINYKIPQVGVLSIGEVATSGNDYLEFYNKTIVVGVL